VNYNRNTIFLYVLSAILISTVISYFVVASGEYSDLLDVLAVNVKGETLEHQVEISLFIATGIFDLVMMGWILKTNKKSIIPYALISAVSITMIGISIVSRTVGGLIVGVEYYVGKSDVLTKALQAISVGLSCILYLK
jgi:hypothetical protein